MSDSTQHLDTISTSVSQKEVLANRIFDAMSPAALFGRRGQTTTGLAWGYYGGRVMINGVATSIANGTVTLTASATNYIEVSTAGTVSKNTTGFSANALPLYVVVTGTSSVSSYQDHRSPAALARVFFSAVTIAMGGTNKTLTNAQALCELIQLTGSSSSMLDVIVPTTVRPWMVHANTSGGGGIRVKTSAGTGVVIPDGGRALLYADGTNVEKISSGGAMLQETFTVASGAISAPKYISGIPASIALLPGVGVTGTKVQFSFASAAAINTHYNGGAWSGTAVDWFDWVHGDVSTDTYEVLAGPVTALRVQSTGGTTEAQLVQVG